MNRSVLLCLVFLMTKLSFCQTQHKDLLNIINLDASISLRQQKIDSFLKINETQLSPSILADCYHDLGSKWYYKNWKKSGVKTALENAILNTNKSLNLKKKQDNLDKGSLEKTLYNLGYFKFRNNDPHEAIEAYLSLVEMGNEKRKIQSANRELGRLYTLVGDFHKALARFDEFIIFYKSKGSFKSKEKQSLAYIYILKAQTYALMGFKEFTLEIQLNLIKARSLLKNEKKIKAKFNNAINQLEGNRLLKIGDFTNAIIYHQKVLTDSTNIENYFDLARIYNSLAVSQISLQKFNKAFDNLRKSIIIDPNYSLPYENMGDLYSAKKQFKKALHFYQKAIVFATDKNRKIRYNELFNITDLSLAPEKIYLLGHITSKANAWLSYYEHESNTKHLEHALSTFALADELVALIRKESTEYQSKLFWRSQSASLYLKAVETCYLLNKPQEAYYFMERNKALLLLEDISQEQAKEIAQLPNAMAKREFQLKRSILLSENELQNTSATHNDTLTVLKQQVYKNKRQYNKFVDSINLAFPDYAQLKSKLELLSYDSFIKNYTANGEVVLHYILNEEQGYGLLSSSEEILLFKLHDVPKLNKNTAKLYGQLTDLVSNKKKKDAYTDNAHQVFSTLIPTSIYQKIKEKKVVIIPDYSLQQIPFESLIINKKEEKYLIEEIEISYAYSLSYLDRKKQKKGLAEQQLLGLAPVQFLSLGLPNLAFSGAEVNAAKNRYVGEVLLHKEATKSNFLAKLHDYQIIHLSTHADIDANGNHWIAFSDEKLYLNEIYASKNQADMVILSACNTSLGELKKGEGVMSLARGFFHSGAKSVVSSLWTINDKSSKTIMTKFYDGLKQGLTKSAALRNAKLDYINANRDTNITPSYWAALIIIGDNSPIKTASFLSQNWISILLGLLIVLLACYGYRKRKQG